MAGSVNKIVLNGGLLLPCFIVWLATLPRPAVAELSNSDIEDALNNAWLILTGMAVFMMQAGFTMLEVGSVTPKYAKNMLFMVRCSE